MKTYTRIFAALLLTLPVLLPVAAHASHASWACEPGIAWTIKHGTNSADTWTGAGSSLYCYDAMDGNDNITGGTNQDNILLGGGVDVANGRDQRDGINGESGQDDISGSGGSDRLYGGSGIDTVRGGDGADNLFGGGFCQETGYWGFNSTLTNTITCWNDAGDTLLAGAGDDWVWDSNSDIHGDGAVDTVDGGSGFDICVVEAIDIVSNCEQINLLPTG